MRWFATAIELGISLISAAMSVALYYGGHIGGSIAFAALAGAALSFAFTMLAISLGTR